MSDWLMKVIKAEAARLLELAAQDSELRADLRILAHEILTATAAQESDADSAPQIASTADRPADSNQALEPLRELTLGRSFRHGSESSAEPASVKPVEASHDSIDTISARCRWKSEAARSVAERLRRRGEGNEFPVENAAIDREMLEWANWLTDCFYWAAAANDAPGADVAPLDDLGGCLEVVAAALSLVQGRDAGRSGNPKGLDRALPLIAEAQSALRAAFQRLGVSADPDQLVVFEWVKTMAARRHVYLKRYMRADDLADAVRWAERLACIELADSGQLSRRQNEAIERLRTQLAPLGQQRTAYGPNWPAIITAVDGLVDEGVPPSNREVRELLLPVIDDLPEQDDVPQGFRLVLREIDRFLATRSAPGRLSITHEPTPEVREAGRLLAGLSVVLIGGKRRREAQESLRRSLGLQDLFWIETKEHQAVATFEPMIVRPDVALVLLAIRWSSHAFGDVKLLCDRHGKPLVRLPGGYSPNQVATQIVSQCSGQLEPN